MKHVDFGRMNGQVLLFGGPYSNFQALEAFAGLVDGRDAVCTGDVLAYCSEPTETAQLFLDLDCPWVAGNCERQLQEEADTCGCGFADGSTCDVLSAGWWPYLRREISPVMVARLNQAPDIGSFFHLSKRYAVIHGGAEQINRFIWPSSPEDVFLSEIELIENQIGAVDGVISGHCGIAFQRTVGGKHWINAGAIGLPPHDGGPETRFAILENGNVTFHRLKYDHNSTFARMQAAGLLQGYHSTLLSGIWPSEEVLPEELRR